MTRKIKAALLALSGTFLIAGAADASVTRYSDGKYIWSSIEITDGTGRHLQTINPSSTTMYTYYATARGYYGGSDTASHRILAKERANAKAHECLLTFFIEGMSPNFWTRCNAYPDVWYNVAYDYDTTFPTFAQGRWCADARRTADALGVSGPVYLHPTVGFWGDAAGTEADEQLSLGSLSWVPCY
jgi:hypothetical protein